MSKKVNTKPAVTTDATTTISLQINLEQHKNVSLRKLAQATEISYPRLLKASKAPIAGQPYDPEAINYTALTEVLADKLDQINWAELNQPTNQPNSFLIKDMQQFEIGTKVYLRRNNKKGYVIAYKTNEQIVLQLEGTEELLCWHHKTFLLNGPALEPRVIAEKK